LKRLLGERTRKTNLGQQFLAVSLQFNDTHQALALDPNYTKARQYLGEAFLQKGDVVKAKEQLMEIADRCGGPCDDYEVLVKAIAAHVTSAVALLALPAVSSISGQVMHPRHSPPLASDGR
jgi:lipoprotein NlpI